MSLNTDLSIMIVDDSGTMLKIMQKNLNQAGFTNVTSACDGKDAIEKLKAGADLIQIYTGFVYEGPGFIRQILKKI